MGKISDTDKAIRNFMRWAERPEWAGEQAGVCAYAISVLPCNGFSRGDCK
jgi:hypothetical protein